MRLVSFTVGILKHGCFFIEIIDNKVKVTVIVKVRINGTIRQTLFIDTPFFFYITESQVAIVPVDITRQQATEALAVAGEL